jgi:aspartyl-tRNA(Asn)/glutamyl-tRNA(Gln) amidotransferase subunit A
VGVIPATVIAAQVRRGELSARDAVAGALVATRSQQERLNVCTHIEDDDVLERADDIDRSVARGLDPGPLAGVPIALKDLIDHAGRVTTCGSSFYRERAETSATAVERLEAAGAVIVSRTGLHEFAFGFSSENHWFGPVRNPLDPSLSPGGSSGGSAAAVAAGQVPIAIGTDTGGSVRVPAALVGAYGLKVTHGRIPLSGVFPLAPSLDTVGPIAGTVDDLAVAYHVMAGYSPLDPWSAPQPVVSAGVPRPDLRGLRVGLPVRWIDEAPVTEVVAESFTRAITEMLALGAEIIEIHDPLISPDPRMGGLFAETAAIHAVWRSEGRAYGPEVDTRLRSVEEFDLASLLDSQAWRSGLRNHTALAFGQVDILVTPATGATRKVIGEDTIATPAGDLPYRTVLSCFSALVNSMGCPALVGPLPSSSNPPPGLQLIAPWWQEHRLLEVAGTLARSGTFQRPW